jgi:beta-lactamase regulating signal transducer with metallopeptidase domain
MSWLLIIGLKNAVLIVPLALAALAAGRCFRRPALAHVLWVLVLVKLVTPPLVDVPVGWSIDVSPWLAEQSPAQPPSVTQPAPLLTSARARTVVEPASDSPGSSVAVTDRRAATKAPIAAASPRVAMASASVNQSWLHLPRTASEWLFVAGCAWLIGSAVTAALMLRRAWLFQRFLRLAARRDQQLVGRVRQLAHEVGLKSCPSVVVVDGVVSPMLWGLGFWGHGRSVQLVFPARLAARLSAAETDALLLHELAHYARGDYWVRLLELVAHVAFWWHPVVWWARREIEMAEEQCCDGWVVERQRGTPLSYAEALLTTIDFLCEPGTPQRAFPTDVVTALPPAACGLGDVPLLRSRLTCIMRGQLGGQLSRSVWIAVLGAGIIVSPVAPAVFATSSRERVEAAGPLPRSPLAGRAALPADESPAIPSASDAASDSTSQTAPAAPPPAEQDQRPPSVIFARAISPNGVYTLEARTGDEVSLRHDRLPGGRLYLNSNRITCAAFSADSQWFVTGHDDGTLRQWDSASGQALGTLRGHGGPINCVAFAPSGTRFAAGSGDGGVIVWDLATQEADLRLANQGTAVSCLRWSPRGDRLAVALGTFTAADSARLVVWSLTDGDIQSEGPLAAPVGAFDWLSDGALVLADWGGGAVVHHVDAGQPDRQVQLDADLLIAKNKVSEANWSPNCPLVSVWSASDLLSGAE